MQGNNEFLEYLLANKHKARGNQKCLRALKERKTQCRMHQLQKRQVLREKRKFVLKTQQASDTEAAYKGVRERRPQDRSSVCFLVGPGSQICL